MPKDELGHRKTARLGLSSLVVRAGPGRSMSWVLVSTPRIASLFLSNVYSLSNTSPLLGARTRAKDSPQHGECGGNNSHKAIGWSLRCKRFYKWIWLTNILISLIYRQKGFNFHQFLPEPKDYIWHLSLHPYLRVSILRAQSQPTSEDRVGKQLGSISFNWVKTKPLRGSGTHMCATSTWVTLWSYSYFALSCL